MKAAVGDQIVVKSRQVGGAQRAGEILEVKASDGSPPYTVRWSDGHVAVMFPGSDARVEAATGKAKAKDKGKGKRKR